MHVGLFVFQTHIFVKSAILAKPAEDLGFESCWVLEHAIIPRQVRGDAPHPVERPR